MKPNPNPFDQTQPVKAGYTRVQDFMDVANYDDALFLEYTKGDRFWEFILNLTPGHQNPGHREAHFNSEHFENSFMAQHWNYFVELCKAGTGFDEARRLMRTEFKFEE